MFVLFLTSLAVLILLLVNELWWRTRRPHSELSRKFVHMTVGTFVAFWPYFLPWDYIRLLSLAFIVVVIISKQLKVFKAIHSVTRPTWGELFFAVVVGVLTYATSSPAVYAAALLQMSLADGLAAVVGTRYGGRYTCRIFRYAKSLIGTVTFFVISLAILVSYSLMHAQSESIALLVGVAVSATILENVAVRGLDNLLVPLLVVLALQF